MTLMMAYDLFCVDHEAYCSVDSMIYYRSNVLKFVEFISEQCPSGSVDCDILTRELVFAYLSRLRESGVKNTSVNTYFRAAKVFLNYCIDEGYCSSDVLRKVKFLKKDNAPIIPLTQWEVDQIDSCFNFKTETGLRNLCIIKYRAYASEDDYPVFVKIGSTEPITEDSVKMFFSRLKKTSGIDRLHPHLLRHTFATSFIIGGGNLEFLRLMMGHSDYSTTKMYLHLAQQAKMLHSDIYRLDSGFFKSGY